jgi:hypothetical protein
MCGLTDKLNDLLVKSVGDRDRNAACRAGFATLIGFQSLIVFRNVCLSL